MTNELTSPQAPQSVGNKKKLKNYLIYLAPCVSLFIECDFWVDPGDFERFFDRESQAW